MRQNFTKALFPASARVAFAQFKKPHFSAAMCPNAAKAEFVSKCKALQSMQGTPLTNAIANRAV